MTKPAAGKFQIFRHAGAPLLDDVGCMTIEPFVEKVIPTLQKVNEAGIAHGQEVKLLINIPGFSLTHVWFKKHYPLPLHSHNADCLYYIIAGNLRLGTEQLGPRDGFFVPSDMPYTYKAGSEGVELLEFRTESNFNFMNHANGVSFWEKAAETAASLGDEWKVAKRPALIDQ